VAGRLGARAAFLEVRSGNASARLLYASLGFDETGRRAGYYHDPEDDAIVLFRPCGPGPLNS
jgi:ribosomal-protein-alanine N-acetyltransferase